MFWTAFSVAAGVIVAIVYFSAWRITVPLTVIVIGGFFAYLAWEDYQWKQGAEEREAIASIREQEREKERYQDWLKNQRAREARAANDASREETRKEIRRNIPLMYSFGDLVSKCRIIWDNGYSDTKQVCNATARAASEVDIFTKKFSIDEIRNVDRRAAATLTVAARDLDYILRLVTAKKRKAAQQATQQRRAREQIEQHKSASLKQYTAPKTVTVKKAPAANYAWEH